MGHHRLKAAAGASPADPYFSSTSLLLLGNGANGGQNNTFVDSSTNNFTITRNGNTTQGSFSPFTGAGGSGYFDGSGDYCVFDGSSSCGFGSGDFTVEMWVYSTSSTDCNLLDVRNPGGANPWAIDINSGVPSWYNGSSNNGTTAISLNTWVHIAFCRSGTTHRIFINGIQTHSFTDSTNIGTMSSVARIGSNLGNVRYFTGHLSNLRILKGTAQYTSTFTPPTSPLTAITNTSLLLNFTNASILDSTAKNDLETVGDAQISTSVKKFGTGSLKFDGTGDALLIPKSSPFDFGTGDFTIEAWVYPTATGSVKMIVDARASDVLDAYCFNIIATEKLDFIYSSSRITSTGTIAQNAWTHVAAVRSSGTIKLYINGTVDGSATYSSAINSQQAIAIGGGRSTGGSGVTGYYFNGYIDDLRITKGVARYTSNFTPPSAQLPSR